ncbi:MAG: type IV pilus secretin PilQ [Acidobacteria bacterium]|nr:type IV pilus secretin PilQ [Acidobacteriota bacterium]
MKSLNQIINTAAKAVFAILLAAVFALSISGQKVDPGNQGKHYGEPGFVGEPIDLNVVNADIRDILSYITDQYGINFVMDKSVKDVPVTVKIKDVPWNLALDSILQAQELGIQVNGNILRVADNKTLAAEGELFREKQNNALDTSPLITEFIRLNYASAAGSTSPGGPSAGTAVSGAGGSNSGAAAGASGGDGLLPIIRRRLSRRGSIETDSRSNSLIITDVAANIAAIKQLVAILDQPEPQVEIEARIVVASRNFSRDIGVQLAALLTGNGAGGQGGTLPGTITAPANVPATQPNNNLLSQLANSVIGFTTGKIGTFQLNGLITAGEQKGQAKVIATPRITTLNNRSAEIKSGTKIPITTVQPGASSGGAVIATTTYVDVPLRLQIIPQITEAGTVILKVTAENASTATIVGNVAPAINNQSMTTEVTVPDGGTTVVGGVLFDDERTTQDRTPGLSSVPVLGNLFKRKGTQRNTNEILFFITPRITRPDFAGATVTPKSTTVIQPVPMGNPPSNSSPTPESTTPVLLQAAPQMIRPEPAATPKQPE